MAYPNRTYSTVRLPGASGTTKFLDTPTNGGPNGSAEAAKVKPIEYYVATQLSGAGRVRTTPTN